MDERLSTKKSTAVEPETDLATRWRAVAAAVNVSDTSSLRFFPRQPNLDDTDSVQAFVAKVCESIAGGSLRYIKPEGLSELKIKLNSPDTELAARQKVGAMIFEEVQKKIVNGEMPDIFAIAELVLKPFSYSKSALDADMFDKGRRLPGSFESRK